MGNARWSQVRRPDFLRSLMLLLSTAMFADVTGSISGVVRDRAQAVVVGAKVTITNTQTNLGQQVTSAPDGSYHFLALAAGTYKIMAQRCRFPPLLHE